MEDHLSSAVPFRGASVLRREGSGAIPLRPVAFRVKPRAHGTRTEQDEMRLACGAEGCFPLISTWVVAANLDWRQAHEMNPFTWVFH